MPSQVLQSPGLQNSYYKRRIVGFSVTATGLKVLQLFIQPRELIQKALLKQEPKFHRRNFTNKNISDVFEQHTVQILKGQNSLIGREGSLPAT